MSKGLTATIGLLLATPAVADNLTGNELLSICSSTDDQAQNGFCLGYVTGVIEGMKWGVATPLLMSGKAAAEADRSGSILLGFCNPEDATLGQYQDVVILYLRNHPSERHNSARILTQLALREAFPCN